MLRCLQLQQRARVELGDYDAYRSPARLVHESVSLVIDGWRNRRLADVAGDRLAPARGKDDGDRLLSAALTDGTRDLLIATKMGQSIRFPEDQVRPMSAQAPLRHATTRPPPTPGRSGRSDGKRASPGAPTVRAQRRGVRRREK